MQMAANYVKRCFRSPSTGEAQGKSSMQRHFTPVRVTAEQAATPQDPLKERGDECSKGHDLYRAPPVATAQVSAARLTTATGGTSRLPTDGWDHQHDVASACRGVSPSLGCTAPT